MPFRQPQSIQIICIEQIKKRDDLAQHIYNWCVENDFGRMIKHIRINLDETIVTTTCVVFIYLFDCNREALESLQSAMIQEEDNLIAVRTPDKVYWSRNCPRGTVTVSKTSDRPKIQRCSAKVLNLIELN